MTSLDFSGGYDSEICNPATFPRSIFQKSASTLITILMYECPIGKISAEMFRNLRGLKELVWTGSNLTEIESGAFDDLEDIDLMNFSANKLSVTRWIIQE